MSSTHTITTVYTVDGSQVANQAVATTDNGSLSYDDAIPTATTNQPVELAFTVAQMKAFLLSSDQDITLKTNSSGSPADTISVHASKPIAWSTSSGVTNPFGTDVTKLYLTNATLNTANVKLRFLVHVSV